MIFSKKRLLKTALAPSLLILLTQTACEPPGQRLFNKNAGKPPVWHKVVIKNTAPEKPPFLSVNMGTPYDTYAPIVSKGAGLAMDRKENILFTIQGVIPANDAPDQKETETDQLENDLMKHIAEIIIKEGATPIQIDLNLTEDASVQTPKVVVILH